MKKVLSVIVGGIGFAYTRKWTAYGDILDVMEAIQDDFKTCKFDHGIQKGDKLQIGIIENKTGNSLNKLVTVGENCK